MCQPKANHELAYLADQTSVGKIKKPPCGGLKGKQNHLCLQKNAKTITHRTGFVFNSGKTYCIHHSQIIQYYKMSINKL